MVQLILTAAAAAAGSSGHSSWVAGRGWRERHPTRAAGGGGGGRPTRVDRTTPPTTRSRLLWIRPGRSRPGRSSRRPKSPRGPHLLPQSSQSMQQTRTVLQRDGPDHLAIINSLPLTARAGGSEGSGGASGRPAVGPVLSGLALQKRLLRAGTMQVALHWQLSPQLASAWWLHSPCRKCRLPSNMMALITSGCAAGSGLAAPDAQSAGGPGCSRAGLRAGRDAGAGALPPPRCTQRRELLPGPSLTSLPCCHTIPTMSPFGNVNPIPFRAIGRVSIWMHSHRLFSTPVLEDTPALAYLVHPWLAWSKC